MVGLKGEINDLAFFRENKVMVLTWLVFLVVHSVV